LLFELVNADALLAVGFGFCGAVGVDGLFGEEVGAATGYDEGGPAVAMSCVSETFWLCVRCWRARVGSLGCEGVTY
jgi:hypothetical protein